MNTALKLLFTLALFFSFAAQARECKSCQEHRNGGSINYGNYYAPGGVYQSGGNYYPGGVYPSYGYAGSSRNPYNNSYGSGRIRQTCGAGSVRGDHKLSGGGCVTTYRGPASDIQYLPKINRQIRQSHPSSISNPWKRPAAVPLQ
jgi:hypothetical protein